MARKRPVEYFAPKHEKAIRIFLLALAALALLLVLVPYEVWKSVADSLAFDGECDNCPWKIKCAKIELLILSAVLILIDIRYRKRGKLFIHLSNKLKKIKRTRLILISFLILFALFTQTKILGWNDQSRFATVEAIVHNHSLIIDDCSKFLTGTGDKYLYQGHFYSDKPPILSIYASIFYFTLKPFITFSSNMAISVYLLTLITIGVISSLGLVYFYRILRYLNVDDDWSIILTLVAGTGTLVLPFSTVFINHVPSGALLTISFYYLLKIKEGMKNAIIAGFLMSLAGSIDVTVFLFIPFALIIFLKEPFKLKAAFALSTIPSIVIYLLLNLYTSGNIMPPAVNPELWDYPGSAFSQEDLTGHATHHNLSGLLIYTFHMIIGHRGLLSHTPILLFSVYALIIIFKRLSKHKKYYLYITLASTAFILLYVFRSNNYSGGSFGIRWFASIMLLLCLPLGQIRNEIRDSKIIRRLFLTLVSISIFFSALGTFNPFVDSNETTNTLLNSIYLVTNSTTFFRIRLLLALIVIYYIFSELWKKLK